MLLKCEAGVITLAPRTSIRKDAQWREPGHGSRSCGVIPAGLPRRLTRLLHWPLVGQLGILSLRGRCENESSNFGRRVVSKMMLASDRGN
jgi:hypothetical protein